MGTFTFKIHARSTRSRARRGIIRTPHGIIQTPAFVTVGTKATVKSLAPADLNASRTQWIFANTYHLVLSPGVDLIEKAGGIHSFSGLNKPIITDSGGFQVFSLADQDPDEGKPKLVKINEDGVVFRSHIDGRKIDFTPEFSVKAQRKIGADFVVAFDECIYNKATHTYAEKSMKRTHEWAVRSLKQFHSVSGITAEKLANNGSQKVRNKQQFKPHTDKLSDQHQRFAQQMYGVIQGGLYKDLRVRSAEYIASLPFFGIAIGGVSVGESTGELRKSIRWVQNAIHADTRPRHLLGVSTLEDVLFAVKEGVDSFDCVLPTRDARIGILYTLKGNDSDDNLENYAKLKITRSIFSRDLSPIDPHCTCWTCKNFSRAYLHHLYKQRELLVYRLATVHNLHFIESFFDRIRSSIEAGKI